MNAEDAVKLLAVARAAYPGMSLVEGQAQLWHGAVGDLPYDDCARAIVEHAKQSSSIVTVADIRGRVVMLRRAAAEAERSRELASPRSGLVPMPDDFRSSVREHRRRAEAGRPPKSVRAGYVSGDGEPCAYGATVVSGSDGMRRAPKNDAEASKWWDK